MPLQVGLTGGIGSGKTVVSKIFEILGIPVYYADAAAKRLMNDNPELKKQIIHHFGEQSYENGILNRAYLASKVFKNKQELEVLNSIVHPATIRDSREWMKKQKTSYAIKEAALIFESGTQKHLDYVIGVSAPEPLRIQRAMKRDKLTREEVMLRISKQIEEAMKMHLCDFVLYNDEKQLLTPQVLLIHQRLLDLAEKKNR